ncbi:MAG: integrin alpha [Anaerolineales bacterium]
MLKPSPPTRSLTASLCLLLVLSLALAIQPDDGRAAVDQEYPQLTLIISSHSWQPDWIYESGEKGAQLGYSVSAAGDVNGDGYDDIIAGAPKYADEVYREGAAFVFHGSAGGLGADPDWIVGGSQQGASFGDAVAGVGDVNGDGFADVIVGASQYTDGQSNEGAAFVYHGSPTGLSAAPDWQFQSDQIAARFGYAVAGAGDINGDGYADVIVGAPGYSDEINLSGAVYVFYGSETGLSAEPDWIYTGTQANVQVGYAVSAAGDINGDGYADILVGAPYATGDQPKSGAVLVFYGSANGLPSKPDQILLGNQEGGLFGSSVSSAGDVNGDSYADIIVGAPRYTRDYTWEGAAFGFLGGSDGLTSFAHWSTYGGQAYARYGTSVSGLRDINDYGNSAGLVGAYFFTDDQREEGRAYLYRGSRLGLISTPVWFADGDKAETGYGFSVSAAGDVDGSGCESILVGAPEYKKSGENNRGAAFVYYCSGEQLPEIIINSLYLPIALKIPVP